MTITTVRSKEIWQSPDKQKTLYEVVIEADGRQATVKSWSKAIAAPGWSGDVEKYDKEGRNGVETFIKQPKSDSGFKPKDEAAIKAMWSISQAIAWLAATDKTVSFEDMEPLARNLFAMVDRVKTGELSGYEKAREAARSIHREPDYIPGDQEPLDLTAIHEVFDE
jgi:hypothetical protein